MKKVMLGAAFASLLVATAAAAQTSRIPLFAQATAIADAPAPFALRDTSADIAASVPSPRSIRLGDITMLKLDAKEVRLRFATLGAPPPPIPLNAPRGQALVTVAVDVVVLGRR